jgi:hypothetical protein
LSDSPFNANSTKEFAFNQHPKFAMFMNDAGIELYQLNAGTRSPGFASLASVPILLAFEFLYDAKMISIYVVLLGFALAISVAGILMVRAVFGGQKMPIGSDQLTWEQSGAKKILVQMERCKLSIPASRQKRAKSKILNKNGTGSQIQEHPVQG